jgi:glutathione S-transferase
VNEPLTLHEYAPSGNCYKIRLTAALLGIAIERRNYDIFKGETRTPEFLANISANGRTPVLQIGNRFLAESNAACVWLATGTSLIPDNRFDHADMLRWMFWEQYNHEPNIATLRFWLAFVGETNLSEVQRSQIVGKKDAGNAALQLMNDQLGKTQWLVGDTFSLADIALFAYTHVAEEGGGFALAPYSNVLRWIADIQNSQGFISFKD